MLFSRRKQESVEIGRSFQRMRRDRAIETAEVLGICPDGYGIPHVRYELTVENPLSHRIYPAGTKMLALDAFAATYSSAVA